MHNIGAIVREREDFDLCGYVRMRGKYYDSHERV